MKKLFKAIPSLVMIATMAMLLTACGAQHTCTRCGREFRDNAYAGVRSGTLMDRECALQYWHPLDITNMRIR